LGEFPLLREASLRRGSWSGGSAIAATDAIDMMAILRASQALSSETSLANLNAAVVKVLGALCGATHVQLVVRPREAPGWFLATSLQPGSTPLSVAQAGAQGLLALSAFHYTERTRQQLLLEDATRDPRFSADPALQGLAHCSLLLMPIVKQGEMQAVLVLENRMRHSAFSADRLDAVSLIAGQLAVSLDNALLYAALESKVAERTAALEEANRKLEQLSVTDALTGLPNRRQFNQALDVEWERARRAGASVGLAMIDIDQFKHYNDHYGHRGGDACLQLVARAMKSGLRAGPDLIARYGGEEFVLLLRDADLTGALACAERVRLAVAALRETHAEATHGIVTVSIGVAACVPGDQLTAAQCLEQADIALYQAKRGGRNQVASLGAPPVPPPTTE
jgi:diguanylate cyclase (GGDEF)-like protein